MIVKEIFTDAVKEATMFYVITELIPLMEIANTA